MSTDAMRAYIRTRRDARGYTAETFAKAIGVPYATYRDFESGQTGDMKASPFLRAVEVLKIPSEHLLKLSTPETSAEEAIGLALKRGSLLFRGSKDEASLLDLFGKIFTKADHTLTKEEMSQVSEVLAHLSNEQLQSIRVIVRRIQDDPESVYWFLGYLEGVTQGIMEGRSEIEAIVTGGPSSDPENAPH